MASQTARAVPVPARRSAAVTFLWKEEALLKHEDIIKTLTIEEKCHLLSGRDFWSTYSVEKKGVPSINLSDGPHGIRKQEGAGDLLGLNGSVPATCFPTAATIANSWDPALGEQIGECLGEEAASQEVAVLLGPGLNIKRSPLCGRNFEYFSEDPYLAGKMAAGYIRGIQKNGISACPKHFAANNTELRRQASNSVVDERTLREIYLTGFEIAVKEADPLSIMSSYNMVNGVYANENEHLLQEILRDQWGFNGFVVSDWGASNDFVEGVRAGSHLEMPTTGGDSAELLKKALADGKISEEMVDRRVDELLDVVLKTHAAVEKYAGKPFDVEAHHAMAMRASEESIVLLKNEDGILPLAEGTKVAVIGDFAETPRYQGAGSSVVNPTKLDSTMGVIDQFPLEVVGFEKGYPRVGAGDASMQAAAVELAKKADVVLLYLGLDEISESEGLDRANMKMPQSQIDLLKAVSEVNDKVVVVMSAGSAVEMPWLDQCKAMVHGYLCGQAGAAAVLKAIVGQVNPSGKLSETYPVSYEDVSSAPYFPAKERNVEYREGLYVGYRYFETVKKPVLFPFGFGMSYTTFAYSGLKVTDQEVAFTITNTGSVDGAEVAQLYVSAKNPKVYRPAKELKGFTKVFLKAGESKEVSIPLDDKAFRYFNTKTDRFEVDGGEYAIMIGANVEDIRLISTLSVKGTDAELPYTLEEIPSYAKGDILKVEDAEFEKVLGTPIPDGSWSGTLEMNDAICQLYYAKSLKARLVYKIMTGMLNKSIEKGKPDLNIIFIYNMPFRAIGKMAGGAVSQEMCESILDIVNGHAGGFFKGVGGLIGGYLKQNKVQKKAKEIK
ncbi:MAG: glycoside hydrolase family 3 C-terminal domain-containing protein [Lachnospiraceae bacterium]|nr:glycoside hydrolase family 3 C-terminal domain-containing protein [Lachnospiraceae bacterium]